MSGQEQFEHEERCLNCDDALFAGHNWSLDDVKTSLFYCIKEQCQESKSVTIKSKDDRKAPKPKKQKDRDRGLSPTLKESRRYIRRPADPVRVAEFAEMLKNPEMLNEKGFPRYSKIFKTYGINTPQAGYEKAEMATAQYPKEVDANGCVSVQAVNSVGNYLKRLTERYQGVLEIYSSLTTKETEPYQGRRVWRWHTLKNKEDLNKQTNAMLEIAKNIQLAAKVRENNFGKMTYDERMDKMEHLDKFFE